MPREGSLGGQRQLASGGPQPAKGTAEVGKADAGLEKGGGGCTDLGTNLIGGGTVGTAIWIRDLGDDATYQEGVGRITPQGGPQDDRGATS